MSVSTYKLVKTGLFPCFCGKETWLGNLCLTTFDKGSDEIVRTLYSAVPGIKRAYEKFRVIARGYIGPKYKHYRLVEKTCESEYSSYWRYCRTLTFDEYFVFVNSVEFARIRARENFTLAKDEYFTVYGKAAVEKMASGFRMSGIRMNWNAGPAQFINTV